MGETQEEDRRGSLGGDKKKYLYEYLEIRELLIEHKDLVTAEDRFRKMESFRSIVHDPEKLASTQARISQLMDETHCKIAVSIEEYLASSKI